MEYVYRLLRQGFVEIVDATGFQKMRVRVAIDLGPYVDIGRLGRTMRDWSEAPLFYDKVHRQRYASGS
jgi:hypothetical protein